MPPRSHSSLFRTETIPLWILSSTVALLLVGVAAFYAWWHSGNPLWIRAYFYYPGAFFFLACSVIEGWLAYLCWREFAPGDLLRPAWFLIALSAATQVAGGLVSHILEHRSIVNPLSYLPPERAEAAMRTAVDIARVSGPLYMIFLAWGLFYVVRACRRNGILGRLKAIDYALLAIVVAFTVHFVISLALSSQPNREPATTPTVIGWMSDPLLCVLLFEAILIRRSTANMGWGLISRCWLSFTVAVFLTSVGDIGLWAAASRHLPYALEAASWYVWFIASAAYALGPAYQLEAMRRATSGYRLTATIPLDERRPSCAQS
jgi:hypothetical protein